MDRLTVNLPAATSKELKALAKINRRSQSAEVQVAIDSHLSDNRALLKMAPKLSNSDSNRTPRGKR